MEKREYPRINSTVSIKFLLGNKVYLGTVTNFSEKGMLIHASLHFPLDWNSNFKVLFIEIDRRITVPVKIVRMLEFEHFYNSIAAEVYKPPKEYLKFVESKRFHKRIRRRKTNGFI